MRIKNATDKGYLDGYPGDGVVLKFLGKARGSVQHAKTPTITGGGFNRGYNNGSTANNKKTDGKRMFNVTGF